MNTNPNTFCIVCGRFDKELVLRRSGLKCLDCIGRHSKRELQTLQQNQATMLLAQTLGSPGTATRSAVNLNYPAQNQQQQGFNTTVGSLSSTQVLGSTLAGTTNGMASPKQLPPPPDVVVALYEKWLSAQQQQQQQQQQEESNELLKGIEEEGSAGSVGGPRAGTAAASTTSSTTRQCRRQSTGTAADDGDQRQSVDLDCIYVLVRDAKTHRVDDCNFIFHTFHINDIVTTYRLVTVDRNTGEELQSVRRRFSQCEPTFQRLKELGGISLPPVPSKKSLQVLQKFTDDFVEQRRQEMEYFFYGVLSDPFLVRNPQFLWLIGVTPVEEQEEEEEEELLQEGQQQQSSEGGQQHKQSHEYDRPRGFSNMSFGNGSFISEGTLRNYRRGNLLGKGAYGAVYLGLTASSKLLAVKIISTESVPVDQMSKLTAELELLQSLNHRNIVKFYGAFANDKEGTLEIFTEFVEGGSVATLINKFGALPLTVMQHYLRQVLCGLRYLHEQGVAHRDIKGDNILVSKNGTVLLADFGCSARFKEVAGTTNTLTGTPLWMAPEVIKGEDYTTLADIWSVGCVGVEMLGREPWNITASNPYSAMFKLQSAEGPPTGLPAEGEMDSVLREFLLRCFERDTTKRSTAAELLEDPFFSEDYAQRSAEIDEMQSPRSPRKQQ